jgi:hypothetical protein
MSANFINVIKMLSFTAAQLNGSIVGCALEEALTVIRILPKSCNREWILARFSWRLRVKINKFMVKKSYSKERLIINKSVLLFKYKCSPDVVVDMTGTIGLSQPAA